MVVIGVEKVRYVAVCDNK